MCSLQYQWSRSVVGRQSDFGRQGQHLVSKSQTCGGIQVCERFGMWRRCMGKTHFDSNCCPVAHEQAAKGTDWFQWARRHPPLTMQIGEADCAVRAEVDALIRPCGIYSSASHHRRPKPPHKVRLEIGPWKRKIRNLLAQRALRQEAAHIRDWKLNDGQHALPSPFSRG